MSTSPYRVSCRKDQRAGGFGEARAIGGPDPRGLTVVTVFVHGYNNDQYAPQDRWDEHVWPAIKRARPAQRHGIILYFWPGDLLRYKRLSTLGYPKAVRTARQSGEELARYLTQLMPANPGLRVQFVGHSLGCRVVLSAVEHLRKHGPEVVDVLLLGAAVPEGECADGGPYGSAAASNGIVVLHSRSDSILRRVFPWGERAARRLGFTEPFPPHKAVGLTGKPVDRWAGEPKPRVLEHDKYLEDRPVLARVAKLFGQSSDHQVSERSVPIQQEPSTEVSSRFVEERRPAPGSQIGH